MTRKIVVDVAVFSPLHGCYSYLWPNTLGEAQEGLRVIVPFAHSMRLGMVIAVRRSLEDEQCDGLKSVDDRLDLQPLFDKARMRWLLRSAQYYLATQGEMFDLACAFANDAKRKFKCADLDKLQVCDESLASAFHSRAAISMQTIRKRLAVPAIQYRVLCALEQGLLIEATVAPHQQIHSPNESACMTLNTHQQEAYDAITAQMQCFQPYLLFGVTGSGKTEVYLRAAEQVVQQGGQVLVLVPEIGLTPIWLSRIAQRFAHVETWHSAMSEQERIATRHRLSQAQIVVGTRSSLFLPLMRLGLIIMDEEHDSSFKQQDGVSYSARDMSLLLAQELQIPVVMGSATPSLESWRQVQQGSMQLLELPERIASQQYQHAPMQLQIIDMQGKHEVLSKALLDALKSTHEKGEQAILFLNRRGYAPALQCTACGHVPECPHCSMRLTLHRRFSTLRCHACGFSKRALQQCASCGEAALLPLGAGTEKLEELLATHLPNLRFARFDRDSVHNPKQLVEVLTCFAKQQLDCLIGTQMLVKGHHFPNVTLVGVVNADMGIHLPDFRAAERWWQQMTQVMGRAGRGSVQGRVLLQTSDPQGEWLQQLGDRHAKATLQNELELRQALNFPPFSRWVRIVFSAIREERVQQAAADFYRQCQIQGVALSSPAPCMIERRAGRYRYELLLRDASRKILPWKLMPYLQAIAIPSGVRRKVEVDPQDMM